VQVTQATAHALHLQQGQGMLRVEEGSGQALSFTIILKAARWRFYSDRTQKPTGQQGTEFALVADYAKRGKTVVWAKDCSTEGELLKTPLIQTW